MENQELIQIIKCPCGDNKFKKAGVPNPNPTLQEAREIGKLISAGCTVVKVPLDDFKNGDWEYCGKHFNVIKTKPVRIGQN